MKFYVVFLFCLLVNFSISTKAASIEILDALIVKYNSPTSFGKITKRTFNDEKKAELHASFEPPLTFKYPEKDFLINQPIGGTLIALLDNSPKGSVVKIAVFTFQSVNIVEAIKRSLGRGVSIQLITTSEGEKGLQGLAGVLPKFNGKNTTSSWGHQCQHGIPDAPGGCISQSVMHNKFVTFSEICRFGLGIDNLCLADSKNIKRNRSYKEVTLQGSWNFKEDFRQNVVSVFFGNQFLFKNYNNYFQRLLTYSLQPKSTDHIEFLENSSEGEGKWQLVFTPRARNKSVLNDVVVSDLYVLDGKSFSRCEIRIANSGWEVNTSWNVPKLMTEKIVELVKQKNCTVKVLLPWPIGSKDEVYKNLLNAGAKVRLFGNAKINQNLIDAFPNVQMHSKYILIEVKTPGGSFEYLAFGSLNISEDPQLNDNAWLRWTNPSREALELYRGSFDRIFNSLSTPSN